MLRGVVRDASCSLGPSVAANLTVGHTLPAGSEVSSVTLRGRRVEDYDVRNTNRCKEVLVEAEPREKQELVLTTAP